MNPLIDGVDVHTQLPNGPHLWAPEMLFLLTLVEVDWVPIWQLARRPDILERVVYVDVGLGFGKAGVKILIWLEIRLGCIWTGALDVDLITDCVCDSRGPLNR